jgi:acetyl esterase/lipase
MRRCRICLLVFTVVAAAISSVAQQVPAPSAKKPEIQAGNINLPVSTENWSVPGDLKTGLEPMRAAPVQTDEQPEFIRELIRLQWRTGDPVDVWLIRPKVAGKIPEKLPVILYLYSYDDTGERFRDNGWCKRATADGYAALGFVSALTDYRFKNRSLKKWFVSELAESLGSTTHDVQLILHHLAKRGDIDMGRVGMFGMGSGGTIAILAAAVDSRISTLDVLDPWGDWPDWLSASALVPQDEHSKYLSKEFLQSVVALDPVLYLPTLRTPKIRVQQILSDPITPSIAKERISAAAPLRNTVVVKYQNAGDLLKSWQITGLSGWIKQQLPSQLPNGNGDDHHVAKNQ